jgi:alpha-L-rhamnosidase
MPNAPTGCVTDHAAEPLAVVGTPRFSWRLDSSGTDQTAYQVRVARGTDDPATVWDSGRVESGASCAVPYDGPPLRARERYRWRVRVWRGDGPPSPWSDPAAFEVAPSEA